MHFLILLLLALAIFLFWTFKLMRRPESRRYLVFLLIIDIWLGIVLVYLLFSAAFDY
jgi:hypothetical protein